MKLLIIGGGPGGLAAARRAAELGAEVTIAERSGLGGVCLHWGCIPTKIMKTAAVLAERCRRAREFGLDADLAPKVDPPALVARIRAVIADQVSGLEKDLARRGVTVIKGEAHMEAPGRAVVETADGPIGVPWDRLILAPGSVPRTLPGLPASPRVLSSDDILFLETWPKSLLIVGGGVIGCEFAAIFHACGVQVRIVEALDRILPLPSVDADCSKILARELKRNKLPFHANRVVTSAREAENGLVATLGPSPFTTATLSARDREPMELKAEAILAATGRAPAYTDLGLDRIGVALSDRGWIVADDRLATEAPGVYAIGDALGPDRVMLAHAASAEGRIAAENAMGRDRKISYDVVPGAIFTTPEIGVVGLTEAQAQARGLAVTCRTVLFRNIGKAQVLGEIAGQAKIVADANDGRVLGVHIIGPEATELIAEATLAVRNGITVGDLAGTIHAHPTLAEVIGETAEAFAME